MGKLIEVNHVSLGGEVGSTQWALPYLDEDHEEHAMRTLADADSLLLGRKTYEGFAEAWPSREGPFADKLNSDPKYVVSTTLSDPAWQNTTVISGDAVEGVSKLKDDTEGTILVAGSGTLVRALLAADLVDELRLMVFPTILGRGERLFPDGIDRLKFKLAESRTVGPDGVQVQVYTRANWETE